MNWQMIADSFFVLLSIFCHESRNLGESLQVVFYRAEAKIVLAKELSMVRFQSQSTLVLGGADESSQIQRESLMAYLRIILKGSSIKMFTRSPHLILSCSSTFFMSIQMVRERFCYRAKWRWAIGSEMSYHLTGRKYMLFEGVKWSFYLARGEGVQQLSLKSNWELLLECCLFIPMLFFFFRVPEFRRFIQSFLTLFS